MSSTYFETGSSKLYAVALIASLSMFGCATEGADDEGLETSNGEDRAEPTALATIEMKGHKLSFYDEGDGVLATAERSAIGEPSLLAGLELNGQASAIFTALGLPVPDSILQFERANGVVATATAPDEVQPIEKHEAGASHFQSDHCPQDVDPVVWNNFPSNVRGFAKSSTNTVTRKYCWAAGHVGRWDEVAPASVMSNSVAAVTGDICFTRIKDIGSATWTIFQGEQINYNTMNRAAKWYDCPKGYVCSNGYGHVVTNMTARIECIEPGDVWRFGGIFKRHNWQKFDGYL